MEKILEPVLQDAFCEILLKKGTFNNNLYLEDSYGNYKADGSAIKCIGLYNCMNFKEIPWENMHDTPYWFSKQVSTMFIGNDPGGHDQRANTKKFGVQAMIHPWHFIPWYFKKEEIKQLKSTSDLLKGLYQKIKNDKRDPRVYYVWGYLYKLLGESESEFVKFIKTTYFTNSCKCYAGGELASPKMRANCLKKVFKNEVQTVNPKTMIIMGNKTSTLGNLVKSFPSLKKTEKLVEITYTGDKKMNNVYVWKVKYDNSKIQKEFGLSQSNLNQIIVLPHITFFTRLNNWDFSKMKGVL